MQIEIPDIDIADLEDLSDVGDAVPGHGPSPCKVAIVSEHPGPDELKHKLPFVGQSGQLLNRLLTLSGFVRHTEYVKNNFGRMELSVDSNVYVTNILKRALKSKSIDEELYETPTSARRPNDLFFAAAAALKAELQPLGANLLIACGDHALQILTNRRSITKWRGSLLDSTLLPGTKVLPIIHPAATLKDYSSWPLTRFDLEKAKRECEFKELILPKYKFVLSPKLKTVRKWARRAIKGDWPLVAFDIETKANHIACIGFAWNGRAAICIPFIAGRDAYWATAEEEAEVWTLVAKLLASPKAKFIGQNVLFDLTHLAAHGVHCPRPFWDTMLAQSVIYPELEKSLAVLCSIHTSQPYYKDMGRALFKKSEKSWNSAQSDTQLWQYNCIDCVVTWAVQREQDRDIQKIVKGYFKTL